MKGKVTLEVESLERVVSVVSVSEILINGGRKI